MRRLTNVTVRQYHRDFYRASNLCVIVVGAVTADELLRALAPVELELVASSSSSSSLSKVDDHRRPWQRPVAPFAPVGGCERHEIEFAEDDEASGLMMWAVRVVVNFVVVIIVRSFEL